MAIVIVAVVIVIAIIVVVFASLTLFRWCALSLTDRQVLSRVAAAWTRPVCGKSLAVLPKPRVSGHAKIAIEIGVHARRGNKWNQKRSARSSNNRALPIHHHHRPEHLRVSRWQCKRGVLGPRECLVCTQIPPLKRLEQASGRSKSRSSERQARQWQANSSSGSCGSSRFFELVLIQGN